MESRNSNLISTEHVKKKLISVHEDKSENGITINFLVFKFEVFSDVTLESKVHGKILIKKLKF